MIEVKFSANSIVELRNLIAEYLGQPSPIKDEPKKSKKATEKPEEIKEPDSSPTTKEKLSITIEDVRSLVLSGEIPKDKVKGLLSNFGAQRITDVPETDLPVFYEQLSALK